MNQPAVTVENVSKRYRKGQTGYHTLREDIYNLTGRLISLGGDKRRDSDAEHIWALQNVSFQIEQGERVGIIGRNGSGKTTLLRLLAGITRPNHGKISVRGRLGVLIEIMAGFHPELTGRENIYLNGAIMGMGRKEIQRKFDEIVAFAELEDFIDTPIKRYSSGMHVRLGFAVSAHLDPDILLIDEVLAVGDAAFQQKCLGKMGTAAQEGRTVVFVSHNMAAVSNLCNRTISLESGRVRWNGPTNEVIDKYLIETSKTATSTKVADRLDRKGDGQIRFVGIHWENNEGAVVEILRSGEDYRLVLTYECYDGLSKKNVLVTFGIRDSSGVNLLLHQSDFKDQNFAVIPAKGRFICRIPRFPLAPGEYSIDIFVGINVATDGKPSDLLLNAAMVKVEYGNFFGSGHPGRPTLCKVFFDCEWELHH